MARDRPPGRGCGALRRCLLGAALLLGLRLCAQLRRAGPGPPAGSARLGSALQPLGPHLPPAPVPPRGANRRQVTYVRSGRRAPPGGGRSRTPEPSCCVPRGRPRRKGPRWHIDLQPWAGPAQSLDEEAWRFLRYISTTQVDLESKPVVDREAFSAENQYATASELNYASFKRKLLTLKGHFRLLWTLSYELWLKGEKFLKKEHTLM